MSDYYCRLESETEETRIMAPLGCEAAEKYARMKWEQGGPCKRLQDVDVLVFVRNSNGALVEGSKIAKFNVTAKIQTILVAGRNIAND